MTRAKSQTPHEAWTGYKPSISHLRPFGCAAFVLIPSEKRSSKWAEKSINGIMMGYSAQSKAYRIMNTETMAIEIARSVQFIESDFPGLARHTMNWQESDELLDYHTTNHAISAARNSSTHEITGIGSAPFISRPVSEDEKLSEPMDLDPDSEPNASDDELAPQSEQPLVRLHARGQAVPQYSNISGTITEREQSVSRLRPENHDDSNPEEALNDNE
ncbi:hypothetical protein V1527DRAFT_449462 [Lipomyces starkeyi]